MAKHVPRCDDCGLRVPACLCAGAVRHATTTRVILLTHRAERRKSTNTGRLVLLGVEHAEVRVRGELGSAPRPPLPEGRRLLLFPHPGARELSLEDAYGEPVVLLVPDGTWNQGRRILARDADARGAEPVALPVGPASRYDLRRAPREGTVSTVEAVARALRILEPTAGKAVEMSLMTLFEAFLACSHQAAGRPHGRGGV